MPYITATTKPLLYAVTSGGNIIAAGITQAGEQTVTGASIASDNYEPEQVTAITGGKPDFDWLAWAQAWPQWTAITNGASIAANTYVWHSGSLYRVTQTHNKQTTWTPLVAVSLFWPWYDPSVIPAWKAPTGAHDAYPLNYRVTHNGKTWRSLVADNVWQPGAQGSEALWLDESAPPATPAWSGASVAYKVNDLVTYNGSTYKCLQAHVSQPGWSPTAVPALWQLQA